MQQAEHNDLALAMVAHGVIVQHHDCAPGVRAFDPSRFKLGPYGRTLRSASTFAPMACRAAQIGDIGPEHLHAPAVGLAKQHRAAGPLRSLARSGYFTHLRE